MKGKILHVHIHVRSHIQICTCKYTSAFINPFTHAQNGSQAHARMHMRESARARARERARESERARARENADTPLSKGREGVKDASAEGIRCIHAGHFLRGSFEYVCLCVCVCVCVFVCLCVCAGQGGEACASIGKGPPRPAGNRETVRKIALAIDKRANTRRTRPTHLLRGEKVPAFLVEIARCGRFAALRQRALRGRQYRSWCYHWPGSRSRRLERKRRQLREIHLVCIQEMHVGRKRELRARTEEVVEHFLRVAEPILLLWRFLHLHTHAHIQPTRARQRKATRHHYVTVNLNPTP